MTNYKLNSFLKQLNSGKMDLIHLRPLSAAVDYAKVWYYTKRRKKWSYPFGPDPVYFIKDAAGNYVAAIYDMGYDLHWYVSSKHRKKGYLTTAMKDIILPHLFQTKNEQRITISSMKLSKENHKASLRVALSFGFQPTDDDTYVLKSEQYQKQGFIAGENLGMEMERVKQLQKQIRFLTSSMKMIHTEIEMKLGNSKHSEKLLLYADEYSDAEIWIEDAYWEYQSKKH